MQFRQDNLEFQRDRDSDTDPHEPKDGESLRAGEVWPEVLLPSQLFFRSRPTHRSDRELNLMAAVLIDAIVCYQSGRRRGSREAYREYLDARNWMESRDAAALFAFENVCEALGLDPGALRHRLKVSTRTGEQVLSLGERRRHRRN